MGYEDSTEDKIDGDYSLGRIIKTSLKYSIAAILSIYAFFGTLMCISRDFRNAVLFLHIVNVPLFANFSKPIDYGLENVDNFYLEGEAGKLGSWFIQSKSDPIRGFILYLHGNGGTRATSHRVGLYKKLTQFGFHVLVIDYRGFGVSDGYPTEEGVVEDSLLAWNWMKDRSVASEKPMFIWGHSLGTGVAIQLSKQLCDQGSPPDGLVLESPFSNAYDAAKTHPLAKPYSILPFYDEYMVKELKFAFQNDKWIQNVTTPILIIHDKSDHIVPFKLGRKLCLAARNYSLDVQCVDIDEKLYHKYIYKSKRLEEIIRNFEVRTAKK